MVYYILRQKDSYTRETENVDLISSSIDKNLMESIIEKFQEESLFHDAKTFIEYLHEKGIDGKLLESEDVMLNEYDSS